MEAKDLINIITNYNLHEKELFDRRADLFILEVRNELERMYNSDRWAEMIGVNQLGIRLNYIRRDFKSFEIDIYEGLFMRNSETIKSEFGFLSFQNYIDSERYQKTEMCGFSDKEILVMAPFVKALERKGFECYADYENSQLIVALNII